MLQSKGRKQVCGIDVFDIKKISLVALNQVIQEALILDQVGLHNDLSADGFSPVRL